MFGLPHCLELMFHLLLIRSDSLSFQCLQCRQQFVTETQGWETRHIWLCLSRRVARAFAVGLEIRLLSLYFLMTELLNSFPILHQINRRYMFLVCSGTSLLYDSLPCFYLMVMQRTLPIRELPDMMSASEGEGEKWKK